MSTRFKSIASFSFNNLWIASHTEEIISTSFLSIILSINIERWTTATARLTNVESTVARHELILRCRLSEIIALIRLWWLHKRIVLRRHRCWSEGSIWHHLKRIWIRLLRLLSLWLDWITVQKAILSLCLVKRVLSGITWPEWISLLSRLLHRSESIERTFVSAIIVRGWRSDTKYRLLISRLLKWVWLGGFWSERVDCWCDCRLNRPLITCVLLLYSWCSQERTALGCIIQLKRVWLTSWSGTHEWIRLCYRVSSRLLIKHLDWLGFLHRFHNIRWRLVLNLVNFLAFTHGLNNWFALRTFVCWKFFSLFLNSGLIRFFHCWLFHLFLLIFWLLRFWWSTRLLIWLESKDGGSLWRATDWLEYG